MEITISIIIGGLLALLGFYYMLVKNGKPENFPPGPPSIPFLGSIPFIPLKISQAKKPIADYMKKHWGDVSGVFIGNVPLVYISDSDILRRVFKMDQFAGRPSNHAFSQLRFGTGDGKSRGLIFSTEEEWKEQRRFSMKSLKDLGFGKSSMEDSINGEVQKLVDLLKKNHEGKPVDLRSLMNVSIVNALWVLITGESLSLNDPKLQEMVRIIDNAVRQGQHPNPLLMRIGTWAVNLFDTRFHKLIYMNRELKKFIMPYIEEHKAQRGDDNIADDYIGTYLKEMSTNKDPSSSFYGTRGLESLLSSTVDLFIAGTETTNSSMIWGILFLLHNTDVQEKVQKELDNVLGVKGTVDYEQRSKLPYTCAVINEIHRKASVAQKGVPHCTTTDIEIDGHFLPKGTVVYGNLIGIHHDQRYWSNPDKFDPERFIENGVCTTNINLMPFSVGKRYCLGQSLAEKELFMFFVGVVKTFELTPSPDHPLPDCGYDSGIQGLVRTPPVYKVILKSR